MARERLIQQDTLAGDTQLLNRLSQCLKSAYQDEQGASLVEYILLAVLIGLAAIAGLTFLGNSSNNRMNNIAATVQSQPS